MRGKLRDKRDVKRDRLKREMMGRRPVKRDNRNLHLRHQVENDEDDELEEESALSIEDEQFN